MKRVRTAALHEQPAAAQAAPGSAQYGAAAAAGLPQSPAWQQQAQQQAQQQQPQPQPQPQPQLQHHGEQQQLVAPAARALLASMGVSPDTGQPALPQPPSAPAFPLAAVPSGGLPPMPRTLTELASGLEDLMAQYGSGTSSGTAPPGGLAGSGGVAPAAGPAAEAAGAAQWQPVGSPPGLQSQPSDLALLLQVLAASQPGAPEAPPPEPAAAAQPPSLLMPQHQPRGPAPAQPPTAPAAQPPSALSPRAPLRGMPLPGEAPGRPAPAEPAAGAAAAASAAPAPLLTMQRHLESLDQEVAQGMAALQQLRSDVMQHQSNHQRQIQLLHTWGSKVNTCTQQMQQAWKELVAAMQHAVGDLHKRVEQQGLLLGMLMAQQEQQAQQAQQDSGSLAKAADALTQQRVQQLAAQLEAERHQRQRLEGELTQLREQVQQLLAGQAAEAVAAAAEADPGSPPVPPGSGPRPCASI